MGTPDYAVPTLKALIAHHNVMRVYTRPDAVSKRGKQTVPSPVKQVALEQGIACETPKTLRDSEVQGELASLHPDIIVVAAYGMLLPQEVLDIPRFGCVNLHASLLPRWRGAAPIQRAILAGDKHVGVTFMKMEAGLDTGDYALEKAIDVDEHNAVELTEKLSHAAAAITLEGLQGIEEGTIVWQKQDESLVTYAHKIEKSDVLLHPTLDALENARRVRASSPSAPARCVVGEKSITVIKAHDLKPEDFEAQRDAVQSAANHIAGKVVVTKKSLRLVCKDGILELDIVKPDGKKEMAARDFGLGLQHRDALTWKAE